MRRILPVLVGGHTIDADTWLVVAPARPAPENNADAHVWRESDLPASVARTTPVADGADLGATLIVPQEKGRTVPQLILETFPQGS